MDAAELVERIWARDATLWTGSDENRWLGWLDEPERMRERLPDVLAFAEEARAAFDTTVLLGMGGSSLAPEVLRRTFEVEGFHVLDTTHPRRGPPSGGRPRSGADALPRRIEVGDDSGDPLSPRLLLGARR